MQGFIPGRLDRVEQHLARAYVEPGKIAGCQVLVARGGEIALQRELGLADRERNRPMAPDTIFRIYSMTKPVTAVALMMLFEEGRFQLNDPVARYLPGWRESRVWTSGTGDDMQTAPAKRLITVRDLLSHTSGLTYGNTLKDVGIGESTHPVDQAYRAAGVQLGGRQELADFAAKVARVPLLYQPGEGWMYSVASDVCGALVESMSGQRFDQFLDERIFGPLGMRDTGFSVPKSKLSRFAACYRRSSDKRLVLSDDPETSSYATSPQFLSGGGGLVSTIADYFRFCEMLRQGGVLEGVRLLAPRTLRLMSSNHLPGGRDIAQTIRGPVIEPGNEGIGYGLGFATTVDAVAAGSLGQGDIYWAGVASTTFWVDPHADVVVIFMTQLTPARLFNFRGQLRSLVYSSLPD
jgi:CubicO group peptidase (beta-lactamase class C family)